MKEKNKVYVIGEIGQNHNGSVDIAKTLIDLISMPIKEQHFNLPLAGIDAVKLTKRDLKEELSLSQMRRPYDSPHSFGATYGEHREALELTNEEHFEVYKHATMRGLDMVETLCSLSTLSLLKLFTPTYLKVASRDLTNYPLLQAMAETKIPIILSLGMANEQILGEALDIITKQHNNISILHCVSQYPTHPDNLHMNVIKTLQQKYGQYTIGFSDHSIGISAPLVAAAMGAKVIEKHITIDRRMKGTDQMGSLGYEGLYRMMRDIRLFERYLGNPEIVIEEAVMPAKHKLERSLASKEFLKKGTVITEDMLQMLSPGDGFKWSEREQVLGKALAQDLEAHEVIYPTMVKKHD